MGGGSNFGGIALPFLRENLKNGQRTRLVAVEPTATPSLTRGIYAFDYGDTAQMAPIVKMHTLGHDFIPPAIHAGGLRYHGMAPLLCGLYDAGLIEAVAVGQIPGLRGRRAVRPDRGHPAGARVGARHPHGRSTRRSKCKETGEKKVILFNLSGHGHFDLTAYNKYHDRPARGLRLSRGGHRDHPRALAASPGDGFTILPIRIIPPQRQGGCIVSIQKD